MENTDNTKTKAVGCVIGIAAATFFTCAFFAIASMDFNGFTAEEEVTRTPTKSFTSTPTDIVLEKSTNTPTVNSLCPTWVTVRSDLSGNRYDIWKRLYKYKPNSIEWEEFRDKSPVCNPRLKKDGNVFIKGKEYFLP
jgi:hypothetical protein